MEDLCLFFCMRLSQMASSKCGKDEREGFQF